MHSNVGSGNLFQKKSNVGNGNVFQKKSNVGRGNVFERNQVLEMEILFKRNRNVCRVHLRWQIVPPSCCPKDHSHALKVNALEIHNVCDTHFLFFKKNYTPRESIS